VVGALWTARRTDVTPHQLVVSSMAFGLSMLVLAVAPTLWVAFLAAAGVGVASITFMTSSTAIVQLRAAPEYRARVLALQAIVFLGSTPIGGPLVGWVSDAFGARAGIVLGGLACLGAAAWGDRVLGRDAPVAGDDGPAVDEMVAEADEAVTLAD
jgi:MFS family permease